jgi:ABC-type histidine transport system ATPase subunit
VGLILISIGMGKGLDNNKVQNTLKVIGLIFCGFNIFVVIYTLTNVLGSAISVLIVIMFFATYFLPPLLYEPKTFLMTFINR